MVRRESSVGQEFALHADICNLVSGFMATDYMSFHHCPGTQGQNMRTNRLCHIYKSMNNVLFVTLLLFFLKTFF